ncbi:MAG: hypothetical protein FWC21_02480 [Treponema sp.]|nr:hypothetical protein [Treponema sp.]
MEKSYKVNGNEFIIEDYNNTKAFASFLPAIAGLWGKPMWAYYVNRGQVISNFGVKDKDGAILEFTAANKAWRYTAAQGFRTFYKINKNFYEPFRNSPALKAKQTMYMKSHSVQITDRNEEAGIETEVLFCTLPNENFPALLRRLTIKNISSNEQKIDCLDGLPMLHPYGTRNWMLKNLSRLAEGWFAGVKFSPNGIPYYKLPVEALDRPEIVPLYGAHFYLGKIKNSKSEVKYCIDPDTIFGEQKDFDFPLEFIKQDAGFTVNPNFISKNKTPSAFGNFSFNLPPGKEEVYYSMTGHCSDYKKVDSRASVFLSDGFFEKKEKENENILNSISSRAFTKSAYKEFDSYCAQNFIDNALRGGFPVTINNGNTYYAYSRVHGDMEREYNNFTVLDEYFSQGNANYRDINQNRRSDVFFNRDVGDDNIHYFMNLIQLDGFNPLGIHGVRFSFESNQNKDKFLHDLARNAKNGETSGFKEKFLLFINDNITIGGLFNFIEDNEIELSDREALLDSLFFNAKKISHSVHGEGYWSDHWHYNTDLIENYLSIFPDRLKQLLLERNDYTFYDDVYFVEPRSVKYVQFRGKPSQIRAVRVDPEKTARLSIRAVNPNTVRTSFGQGEIYNTNLLGKLLCIIANKFASLDPEGLGVEMESDKPNWCDALNGLPGLFGSSSAESLELSRLVSFVNQALSEIKPDTTTALFSEAARFLKELVCIAKESKNDFDFWDKSHNLKESFREITRLGISGNEEIFTVKQIQEILSIFENKLSDCKKKIEKLSEGGVIPTCFAFIPDSYEPDENAYEKLSPSAKARSKPPSGDNQAGATAAMRAMMGEKITPLIIKSFKRKDLPLFLEGPVHYLRLCPDKNTARNFHRDMLNSALYDRKLKMFKINAPVADAEGIGRITVFTPGWLENESIWLHMEYKYLLELLRNGMADDFYEIAKTALIPFLDPAMYGRSVFENSSFLASSAHPEEAIHGQGFVARLSGATAEFISMWIAITSGLKPFYIQDSELCFALKPCIKSDFFTEDNLFSFNLFGNCEVIYRNDSGKNTYGENAAKVKSYHLTFKDGSSRKINETFIKGKDALSVREGGARKIEVNLS